MTDDHDLYVEVRADEIIVTMQATRFRVVYRKPGLDPGLAAKLHHFPEEQNDPIPHTELFVLAGKLANDKARELG
jgi:hypothetical protein